LYFVHIIELGYGRRRTRTRGWLTRLDRTYSCKRTHQHRLNNRSSKLLIYLKINLGIYVNMPKIPTITNHTFIIKSKNVVENLAQPSLHETVELRNSKSSTQLALT
jgi:hypothetical protein